MRTCIAVQDAADGMLLAFVNTTEIHSRLTTVCDALISASKVPTGVGSQVSPFIIDSFGTILGYIDKRNAKKEDRMWFKFFGVDFYQNGNMTADQTDYYIGLKDGATLSYPDMRDAMETAAPDPAIKSAEVKAATGVAASNKYELLAIVCLFIAEGRRDRISLVTHLLLCDLISDQVKYGSGGAKTRSLATAVDKDKSFTAKYDGATAAGDSPMSQKGAVGNAHGSHNDVRFERKPQKNRYYDKTNSLLAQWFAAKYSNPNYTLMACRPDDEARLRAIDDKMEAFLVAKGEAETKKKSEKAWQAVARGRKPWEPKLAALKAQVLAELSAMLKAKIEKVSGGQATGFVYQSEQKVDTSVIRLALA
jgi:hypothetical protein